MSTDHILRFATIAAREAAFPTPETEDGSAPTIWGDSTRTIMLVEHIVSPAQFDAEGNEASPQELADGAWLLVQTPGRDAEIEAMDECVCVLDPDDGAKPIIAHSLSGPMGQISPTLGGVAYDVVAGADLASVTRSESPAEKYGPPIATAYFKMGLQSTGWLTTANEHIAAMEGENGAMTRLAWEYASEINPLSPTVQSVKAAIEMPDADLVATMEAARTIKAAGV